MNQPTKESFLKDVADHVMTIELDDGVHRCLHFGKKDGSRTFYFRIITFPGGLTFTGDMQTYTFCRLHDMLCFFRDPDGLDGKYPINPSYWSEKLQGPSKYKEFSPENAKEAAKGWIETEKENEASKSYQPSNLGRQSELMEADLEARGGFERVEDLIEFANDHDVHDWYESCFEAKTYHFIWCCYALVWAIKLYDDHKHKAEEVAIRKPGTTVIVDNPRYHGRGTVVHDQDCPVTHIPVILENGNVWFYERETCKRDI